MIGLVAVSAAGRRAAAELADALDDAVIYEGTAATALPQAFIECDAVVAFVATGIAIRVLASVLDNKVSDPAVVTVDEGRRFAIALLGGHHGANELATEVADLLDATAVITTATDATGVTALDQLDWPAIGAIAAVTNAILDGRQVDLVADQAWPIPALPPNVRVAAPAEYTLRITDRAITPDDHTAVLHPPSLVVGVGASRGVTAAEVGVLIDQALADAGLSAQSVRHVATVEAKAHEAGIVEAAAHRGWPVVVHSAAELAAIAVPNPSAVVQDAVGTPSVAEAAALITVGPIAAGHAVGAAATGPTLVAEKRASAMATVAIARHAPRGRLAIIGLGPGARDLLAPRAVTELRRASVVVGLDQYVDQIRDLLRPGTDVRESGLGHEEERARTAVTQAQHGHAVALIGSGDAGVYAMASPALELAGADIDVVTVPGITAALAASALLGAPLGHDHVNISLSDLHTPWEAIRARVTAAAEADLVVTFYNPRSRGRDWQLPEALSMLAKQRPPTTPVGIVWNASRTDERTELTTLAEFDPTIVDMYSVVIVGSSNTVTRAGRMITPRGYRWRE
jgi:cobalt-precorrin 5A hydrolase / precorrin-3B C17-methyltransferase